MLFLCQHQKFAKKPEIIDLNTRALKAGMHYGETVEAIRTTYRVPKAKLESGTYRNIMGNQATAWGFMSAAEKSGMQLFLGSYPITPASDILHELSKHKHFGVTTFQAEDEIAAVMTAIGALVVYDSIRLAKLADVATCMSLEVLQGSRVGTEPEN